MTVTTAGEQTAKQRLLHQRLAALVADLRHGEMIYVADAGSGSGPKAVVPLAPDVEVIDLGVATNVPTVLDVLRPLVEVGDFEAAIIPKEMTSVNPVGHRSVSELFGENVIEVDYLPDLYQLRDRCKAFVQTGDYGLLANVILVGGYPSPNIRLDWLKSQDWYFELIRDGKTFHIPTSTEGE